MARKKPIIRMVSYGIYDLFDKKSRELPKIIQFGTEIPARLEIEFGYILEIKQARGMEIEFCMEHPPFEDSSGNIAPPFTGTEFINASEYRFFLGDTFWKPLENKVGNWRLITRLDGKIIADKTFNIVPDDGREIR